MNTTDKSPVMTAMEKNKAGKREGSRVGGSSGSQSGGQSRPHWEGVTGTRAGGGELHG